MINEVTRHEKLTRESTYTVNQTVLNSDRFTPWEIRFGIHLTEGWMGQTAMANTRISLSILDTVLSFLMCVYVCVVCNVWVFLYLPMCTCICCFCMVCTVLL